MNGLELSGEKTQLMLFNNGKNPKVLPQMMLEDKILQFSRNVKFLGVHFTPKLNWRYHIEYLINKGRQRLNLLKIISAQSWGQDTETLIHLSVSLVRSKLIYGQEVYFSAPQTQLKRLQSIDSKALKVALGVPVHTNTLKTYKEANLLSLDDQRKLAAAKYVTRSLSVCNSVTNEIFLDCKKDFPKRARNISYLQPIRNYTEDLFSKCDIDIASISEFPVVPIVPQWEHISPNFDIDYITLKKEDNLNLVSIQAKEHLENVYPHHLKIFTDGSVLESFSGAGFVIPSLRIEKSFCLGKSFSVFTAELYAILMALNCIDDLNKAFYSILICVDSKSVLCSLQNWDVHTRKDLIFEIKLMIHSIIARGMSVDFCWIPSHCGIYGNDQADQLAKEGALRKKQESTLNLDKHEINSVLQEFMDKECFKTKTKVLLYPRALSKLVYKMRLNSWKTKFLKDVECACGLPMSVQHIMFECQIIKHLFDDSKIDISSFSSLKELLYSPDMVDIAKVISTSEIVHLL